VDWLKKNQIPWDSKDPLVWKDIYKRVESETYICETYKHWEECRARGLSGLRTRDYWTPDLRELDAYLGCIRKYNTSFGMKPLEGEARFDPVAWIRWYRKIFRYEATVKSPPFKMWCIRHDYLDPAVHGPLGDALKAATKDRDFVDNERWAKMSNGFQMKEWRRARDGGCCGSYDEVITIDGEKYIFGFNYGH